MWRLLPIAIRNIGRNRRRSAITLAAIAAGTAAAIFLNGFAAGLLETLTARLVEGSVGAVQLHRVGFLQAEEEPLKLDLAEDAALVARLRAVPGVRGVTGRLTFEALVGNGLQSTMAMVTAVDPAHEAEVCPGRWTNAHVRGLEVGGEGGVIGRALSQGLGVVEAGQLQLLATSQPGTPNILDLKVQGVAGTTTPLESKRGIVVPLAFAQELLRMPGRVTEYAVGAERVEESDELAARLRLVVGPGIQVSSWGDLLPQVRDGLQLIGGVLAFVTAVLLALVITGIANTMLMSVHERVREIGTMLAVGVRRGQIVVLFIAEAMVLGLMGGLAGGAAGATLVAVLHARGVPVTPPGSDVPALIRPYVAPSFVLAAAAIAVAGALVAALYPAWRASKLAPVDALRSV